MSLRIMKIGCGSLSVATLKATIKRLTISLKIEHNAKG